MQGTCHVPGTGQAFYIFFKFLQQSFYHYSNEAAETQRG